jgi:HEPN domain-containing protein/predicted ATPase
LIDLDQLKTAIEGLADPATLNDHPLTTAPSVDRYRQHHPEVQTLITGEILGRVLAETWRQQCLPPTLNARLRREWNLFLTLEVGYFFPFRHRRRFPGGLAQLGALLLDRDHVALVIADGDERQAQALQHSDYADFWEMLAPTNKKETLALGISTMAARRDVALRRLAQELKRMETQPPTAEAASRVNPMATEQSQPGMACSEPIDTLALYREQVRSTTPRFIPEEWSAIIERACSAPRCFIAGPAGSGKTGLMNAISHHLCQTEIVPLYLCVTDYVSQAPQLDVWQFAARHGCFGQIHREEGVRLDFEQRLAEAQQANQLVLLVDQVDDLYEEELRVVSQRLAPFQRLILAERTPRLPLPRETGHRVHLPTLSASSAVAFLRAVSGESERSAQRVIDFQQWNLPLQPGFLSQAAHHKQQPDHPVLIMQQWITDQITGTRSTGTTIAEGDQTRRLLHYLSGLRYDIAARPEATSDLIRDNVRRAFWNLSITPASEEQGWSLIDFCCRAGLLQKDQAGWQFTQPVIELALAAEFIMEQTEWVSLRPQHRELMRWTAALIAQRGSAPRQRAFIQQLRRALSTASRLSALEAADILSELALKQTAEVRAFKAEVIEQLQGLRQIGSRLLSDAAHGRIDRLIGASHCSTELSIRTPLILAEQLQPPAHDLREVLRRLSLPLPANTETRWLEERRVISGLIDGLCQTTWPEVKRDCAAWLDRAPLTKVLEVHVPEQRWWKSRPRSALEILAHHALEPEGDELTRRWLYIILAREDRVLQLWQRGDEYLPLVYDLLLALDQRLFLVTGLLTKPEWRLMD